MKGQSFPYARAGCMNSVGELVSYHAVFPMRARGALPCDG